MIFSLQKLKSGEVFGHARAQTFSRMMHGSGVLPLIQFLLIKNIFHLKSYL